MMPSKQMAHDEDDYDDNDYNYNDVKKMDQCQQTNR